MSDDYLIWSHEHAAWWRANRHGYTEHLSKAGHYSREEALSHAASAIIGTAARLGALPELPVRVADIEAMINDYKARFPGAVVPEVWE